MAKQGNKTKHAMTRVIGQIHLYEPTRAIEWRCLCGKRGFYMVDPGGGVMKQPDALHMKKLQRYLRMRIDLGMRASDTRRIHQIKLREQELARIDRELAAQLAAPAKPKRVRKSKQEVNDQPFRG